MGRFSIALMGAGAWLYEFILTFRGFKSVLGFDSIKGGRSLSDIYL